MIVKLIQLARGYTSYNYFESLFHFIYLRKRENSPCVYMVGIYPRFISIQLILNPYLIIKKKDLNRPPKEPTLSNKLRACIFKVYTKSSHFYNNLSLFHVFFFLFCKKLTLVTYFRCPFC